MTRSAAISAYLDAKRRRDTRAMSAARGRAYEATHAVLARGPVDHAGIFARARRLLGWGRA